MLGVLRAHTFAGSALAVSAADAPALEGADVTESDFAGLVFAAALGLGSLSAGPVFAASALGLGSLSAGPVFAASALGLGSLSAGPVFAASALGLGSLSLVTESLVVETLGIGSAP